MENNLIHSEDMAQIQADHDQFTMQIDLNDCAAELQDKAYKLGLKRGRKQFVKTLTNEDVLEFLSVGFRHVEIKGNLDLADVVLGLNHMLEHKLSQ